MKKILDRCRKICYNQIRIKGFDGEGSIFEPEREVVVGANHREWIVFVALEPGGRKQYGSRTSS